MAFPTKQKASAILDDGEVRGKPLTTPQRGLMGTIASGKKPKLSKKKPPPPGNSPPPALASPKPPPSSGMAMANRAKPQLAIGQRAQLGPRVRAALRR